MTQQTGKPAIVAKRTDNGRVDTTEIAALTDAAGYRVADEVTQARPEDPGSYFGSGKVAEIAERAADTGAALVAVDGELTPNQTIAIRDRLPDGTRVFDRYRLVLEIFADQATTRRAALQVELAQLRYELPRIEETADLQFLNKLLEKGTPVDGVKNRIAELERKIDALPSPAEQYRERRREQGFDLVTIAGYTNAGKSTLLHRLADELDLAAADPDHPDQDATAAVEDRLFKTLETTTRRATLDGRPVLFTDTVGFVDDLPHWLVESFSETLSEAAAADAVVLVVDASDDPETMQEKLDVSLDVLASQGVDRSNVVTALNKVDLLDERERGQCRQAIGDRAPTPIPVSVTEGTNLGGLVDAVTDRLPTERAELAVPNCDEAMALVSRAYDRATVEDVEYGGETVRLVVRGRPDVVAKLEARAAELTSSPP
ncbi:GTPase HflX [Halobacteriales archaeon QH_1_68_42]|nr:MAG: GTPase HflX [Halobacteriales archaeon QH_1_68_42]